MTLLSLATNAARKSKRRKVKVMEALPSDPSAWMIGEVDRALASLIPDSVGGTDGYESNRLYLDGDHFQDARNWKGPGWTAAGTMAQSDKDAIEQSLAPVPEVEDCVDYRRDGVCGIEAEPSVAPKNPSGPVDEKGKPTLSQVEEAERDEWASDIGTWWRTSEFWRHVKEAFAEASIAEHGCIRLVPLGRNAETDDAGRRLLPAKGSRAEALGEIECTSPRADACGIYTDPDTFQRFGLWRGKDKDGTTDLAEIWFARDGETVFRRIVGENATERRYPWGGLLPIVSLKIPPILTTPVRNLQGALDTASTALGNNTAMHGYTQRNEFNVMPPGEWLTTPPTGQATFYSRTVDGVTYYFHETGTRVLGGKVTVNMYGIETVKKDVSGAPEYEYQQPSVEYHEPSTPDNIIKPAEWYIDRIREACKQGHRTSGSTAEASGDAYEQRRARYVADIRTAGSETAGFVERGLTVLAVMADWLAGSDDPTFLEEWEVGATVHTDAGPVSSGKMQQIGEWMDKGRISRSTGMQMIGIRDVRDEEERIREQETLSIVKERAEAAKALIDAGADRKAAWMKVGFTEEEAGGLARTDGFTVEQ